VPSSKAKCARFLARVRASARAMRQLQPLNVCDAHGPTGISSPQITVSIGGGAIACRAKIQIAGGGQQKALLLSAGEQADAQLRTLADTGAKYNAMLCDAATAAEVADVATAPVATVPTDSALGDRGDDVELKPVYQLFDEIAPELGRTASNADWLYTLQRASWAANDRAGLPHDPPSINREPVHVLVAQAYTHASQGDWRAALKSVDAVAKNDLHGLPLVARFCAKVRQRASRANTTTTSDESFLQSLAVRVAQAGPM